MILLLQARIRCCDRQSRRSALRHTVRVCLSVSHLRVPVSRHVCTLSQRTFMNNAGQEEHRRILNDSEFQKAHISTTLLERFLAREDFHDVPMTRPCFSNRESALKLQNWTPCRPKRMMSHHMSQWSRCIILTGRTEPWLRYFPPTPPPSPTPAIVRTS